MDLKQPKHTPIFQVMIEDPNDEELYQLECNLVTGATKKHIISFDGENVDTPIGLPANLTDRYEASLVDTRAIPAREGYRYNNKFFVHHDHLIRIKS